jgi:hypothetical protein
MITGLSCRDFTHDKVRKLKGNINQKGNKAPSTAARSLHAELQPRLLIQFLQTDTRPLDLRFEQGDRNFAAEQAGFDFLFPLGKWRGWGGVTDVG